MILRLTTNHFPLSVMVGMLFLNGCDGTPLSLSANRDGIGSLEALLQRMAGDNNYGEPSRLKPDDAMAYFDRGVIKALVGQHEAAITDYDEAIRLKPDLAKAYYRRGFSKDSLGQHEAAIADYDQAIRLNRDYAEAYYNRGNVKVFLEQNEAAITDYDRSHSSQTGLCRGLL